MKKSELIKIIKEEVSNVLAEELPRRLKRTYHIHQDIHMNDPGPTTGAYKKDKEKLKVVSEIGDALKIMWPQDQPSPPKTSMGWPLAVEWLSLAFPIEGRYADARKGTSYVESNADTKERAEKRLKIINEELNKAMLGDLKLSETIERAHRRDKNSADTGGLAYFYSRTPKSHPEVETAPFYKALNRARIRIRDLP
tara:strand:- start:4123 stop:4710 length:588 start_codon:yes stop_codon:yes gene_type:complete